MAVVVLVMSDLVSPVVVVVVVTLGLGGGCDGRAGREEQEGLGEELHSDRLQRAGCLGLLGCCLLVMLVGVWVVDKRVGAEVWKQGGLKN